MPRTPPRLRYAPWLLAAGLALDAGPAAAQVEAPAPQPVDAPLRPSPTALRALCADAFAGVATQSEPPTPIAIVPAASGDPLATFVVDYLHWCLGTERGLALVERARLDLLLRELETQRLLGADDITHRVAALAGGESVLVVTVHVVDPETRDLTTRLSRVSGAQVLHATAPVRVEAKNLIELHRATVARGNRLVATGLSAVLPGAGQLYNDQPWKAGVVMAVEAGLLGAALAMHLQGAEHEEAYDRGIAETVGRADQAEDAWRTRNALLWAALGVWALQVADAAVFGGVPADVEQRYRDRIGVGPMPGGVSLGGRF